MGRGETVNNETPESIYESYWKSIVEKDGVLDVEQVKKELFDFWQVMQLVPPVYCHVTGGQISKLLTDPDAVMSVADDHYAKLYREAEENVLEVPEFHRRAAAEQNATAILRDGQIVYRKNDEE